MNYIVLDNQLIYSDVLRRFVTRKFLFFRLGNSDYLIHDANVGSLVFPVDGCFNALNRKHFMSNIPSTVVGVIDKYIDIVHGAKQRLFQSLFNYKSLESWTLELDRR